MDTLAPVGASAARLPDWPEPVEVEVEFTNRCNAHCSACPRDEMPAYGQLDPATLDLILEAYALSRPAYALNRRTGGLAHPRVAVAGGGEPLLHPRAVELLARAVARQFPVHLVTNGSLLTDELSTALLDVGLASVSISFWGTHREEYESAMRLPFERTLARVERFAQRAARHGLPVQVAWVRAPSLTSSAEEIAAFWRARGVEVDMGDNQMWNRGGLVTVPAARRGDQLLLPDPRRRVWCADLFFSDTYDWRGRCLLCCCNYFTAGARVLGSIQTHTPARIAAIKAEILAARPLPSMCQVCQQPRRQQSRWLAEAWLALLEPAEHAMLTYDEGWAP